MKHMKATKIKQNAQSTWHERKNKVRIVIKKELKVEKRQDWNHYINNVTTKRLILLRE